MNKNLLLAATGCGFLLALGAAIFLIVSLGQPVTEQSAARETEVPNLKLVAAGDMPPRLAELGIHVAYVEQETSPGKGKYTCGPLSAQRSILAGQTIDRALADVPDKAPKKMKLKYLIVCGYAKASGNEIGGIPVPPLKLLMLDMHDADGFGPRHIVLHELYHYVEYRLAGIRDARWNKQFGGYDNSYRNGGGGRIGAGKTGFINTYAQTFPHEERAEIFAHLLTDPAAIARHAERTDDTVLDDKVRFMVRKIDKLLGLAVEYP